MALTPEQEQNNAQVLANGELNPGESFFIPVAETQCITSEAELEEAGFEVVDENTTLVEEQCVPGFAAVVDDQAWTGTAVSQEPLNGSGWLHFEPYLYNVGAIVGIAPVSTHDLYQVHGIMFDSEGYRPIEFGVVKADPVPFSGGDIFSIYKNGFEIEYQINGTTFYKSETQLFSDQVWGHSSLYNKYDNIIGAEWVELGLHTGSGDGEFAPLFGQSTDIPDIGDADFAPLDSEGTGSQQVYTESDGGFLVVPGPGDFGAGYSYEGFGPPNSGWQPVSDNTGGWHLALFGPDSSSAPGGSGVITFSIPPLTGHSGVMGGLLASLEGHAGEQMLGGFAELQPLDGFSWVDPAGESAAKNGGAPPPPPEAGVPPVASGGNGTFSGAVGYGSGFQAQFGTGDAETSPIESYSGDGNWSEGNGTLGAAYSIGLGLFSFPIIEADATLELPLWSLDVRGEVAEFEENIVTLPLISLEASGGAEADITLPLFSVEADGVTQLFGTADMTLPLLSLEAEGLRAYISDADIVLPLLGLEAYGSATADLTLPLFSVEGEGTTIVIGYGELTLPLWSLDAQGITGTTGEADITLPLWYTSGFGGGELTLPLIGVRAESYVPQVASADTWAMNAKTTAVSKYSNYQFTKFVQIGGRTFGLLNGNLYLLTGADDDGTEIDAEMQTFATDFGSNKRQRVPRLYIQARAPGGVCAAVVANEEAQWEYQSILTPSQGMITHPVKVGRGLKAHQFGVAVRNIDGGEMVISNIEFKNDKTKAKY